MAVQYSYVMKGLTKLFPGQPKPVFRDLTLSFIPGAFLGAATAVSVVVGANGTWGRTVIALVIGAVLGYLSEMVAGALSKPAKAAA